jgi:hypothetical protein
LANEWSITQSDLIEEMMNASNQPPDSINKQEIIEILEDALKLKANAGGAIKGKIKKVLNIFSLKG